MIDSRYDAIGQYNEFAAYLGTLGGGDNSKELSVLQKKMKSAIRKELTPKQWRAIYMYYIDGLTMTDIARSTGVSVSTVSRHISRGMERLRDRLKYSTKRIFESK